MAQKDMDKALKVYQVYSMLLQKNPLKLRNDSKELGISNHLSYGMIKAAKNLNIS